MRFRPAVVVALFALVLSGAVVAAAATGSGDFGGAADATDPVDRAGSVDWRDSAAGAPNETANGTSANGTSANGFERADPGLVITVQLRANGDARWRITHRYVVNGSNETRAFESFADEVTAGERDVGVTRETFVEFASAAGEATGREMEIRDAGWTSSSVENGTGEVTYAFTWTNFGEVEGDQVVVEDAFRSPDGTWFPRLYEGQRLAIRPPDGLNIVQTPADKGLNQRALVWNGYRQFEPGYLSVVLERPEPTTSTTTTDPGEGTGPPLSPFLLGVGFALLLVFVGAGSYFFARWQTLEDDDGDATPGAVTEASDGGSPPASAPGEDGEPATAAGATAGATAEPGGDSTEDGAAAGAAGGAVASAADDDEGDEAEFDETLLSDEERVLRLLDRNGGRMKQANIVTETGWSNAKVSQLLSGMDEDDEIQKLRIGRENLITLPDENVADFGDDE